MAAAREDVVREGSVARAAGMNNAQQEKLIRALGELDGPRLIAKLDSLGIGENILFTERGDPSIPLSCIANLSKLQSELSSLSHTGRTFQTTVVGDRLEIDTYSQSDFSSFLPPACGRRDRGISHFFAVLMGAAAADAAISAARSSISP